MSYAKRLEQALIEADLKAAELSRRTGISKACLSQYLSGVSIPREDRQELIADALSKDLGWFFPEKDEPIPGADEELPDGRVPVYLAAAKLQMSPQSLRLALQQGRVPFGFAAQSEKGWTYHISSAKLQEYLGIKKESSAATGDPI
jgi:transcriptional regulator with XRE-family HTH domain